MSDQILRDPQSDLGNLIHFTTNPNLNSMVETFTQSQLRAYRWIKDNFNTNRQIFAAIVGPAGTGKSYLLTGLIELAKSKGLVVSKLAPSGVAAHLIGRTIHNFFSLDINCNSSLENGTVQVTKVKKTDILVIDEFSTYDFFVFRTAEGLCRSLLKITNIVFPGVAGMLLCLVFLPNYHHLVEGTFLVLICGVHLPF